MAVSPDVFRRLCAARALLLEDREALEPLPIAELARRSGMARHHFIRRYHELFGTTPHQARIGARLERAKQLLAGGEHSVTEVCFEVGFSSLGSFSALFARRVGEAPSSYQRRVRRMVSVPGRLPEPAFPGCLSLMQLLPAGAFRAFREAAAG
jgi:AraC-like DNA-binding protein